MVKLEIVNLGVVVVAELKLNEKHKRFGDEYLIDFNGKQAAIRAGYSAKTAEVQASKLLSNPKIKEYIEKRKAARAHRTEISQDFVLRELLKIAQSNGTVYANVGKRNRVTITPTDELTPEQCAAVAGVKKGKGGEIEVKTYDKLKALELLGRHLGLFDKQISGSDEDGETGVVLLAPVDDVEGTDDG